MKTPRSPSRANPSLAGPSLAGPSLAGPSLAFVVLLLSVSPAEAVGCWNLPGTPAQFFGYGYGVGYHAPIVRSPCFIPQHVPRRATIQSVPAVCLRAPCECLSPSASSGPCPQEAACESEPPNEDLFGAAPLPVIPRDADPSAAAEAPEAVRPASPSELEPLFGPPIATIAPGTETAAPVQSAGAEE